MEKDDKPAGQILSRREALKLLGVGSAAFLAASALPGEAGAYLSAAGSPVASALNCVVRPELTIGPYFVDDQLNRADLRSDPFQGSVKEGVPLALHINVFNVSSRSCRPLEGAQVDVWHCDAFGIYSGVLQRGFNTLGQKFLRGYQITNAKGSVQFQTIYPGWYSGRTVHIHFMIRTKGAAGQDYEFTSQLFFLDALTDQVHAREPYVRKGPRDTRNLKDSVFKNGGIQLLLNVTGDGGRGYIATINVGLDLTNAEVGQPDTYP
ncbi:MAG TPA: intradiol ring-cleavage dioxygenase [Anaerolineales bacterium]|nr:intradiol ring-cleavage dioxygenase [Anaerolineales bacterium]